MQPVKKYGPKIAYGVFSVSKEKNLQDLSPSSIASAVTKALAEELGVQSETLQVKVLNLAYEPEAKNDASEISLLVTRTYDSFAGYRS